MENNEFVETENVHGCMYGTLKESIDYAITTSAVLLFCLLYTSDAADE